MIRRIRSRPLRFVLRAVVFAIVFSLGWFVIVRVTAPLRAIRVSVSTVRTVESDRTTLRIGAFNIAHGRGLSEANYNDESYDVRMNRLYAIGDLLRDSDLDAVVLNEVDFDAHWSGGVNQAQVIAKRAGFSYVAEQTHIDTGFPFWRLRFGNAVLSRHPIEDAERIDLPALVGWESIVAGHKRGLLCTIAPTDRPAIRLFAVHLSHRDETTRIASARIIDELAASSDPPLIAAGDFNSTPADFPKASIVNGQTALGLLLASDRFHTQPTIEANEVYFTYRSDRPDRVIDWVLAPPEWLFAKWLVVPTDLSDHRLVIAELEAR